MRTIHADHSNSLRSIPALKDAQVDFKPPQNTGFRLPSYEIVFAAGQQEQAEGALAYLKSLSQYSIEPTVQSFVNMQLSMPVRMGNMLYIFIVSQNQARYFAQNRKTRRVSRTDLAQIVRSYRSSFNPQSFWNRIRHRPGPELKALQNLLQKTPAAQTDFSQIQIEAEICKASKNLGGKWYRAELFTERAFALSQKEILHWLSNYEPQAARTGVTNVLLLLRTALCLSITAPILQPAGAGAGLDEGCTTEEDVPLTPHI